MHSIDHEEYLIIPETWQFSQSTKRCSVVNANTLKFLYDLLLAGMFYVNFRHQDGWHYWLKKSNLWSKKYADTEIDERFVIVLL